MRTKKMLAAALSGAMVLGLMACGGQGTTAATTAAAAGNDAAGSEAATEAPAAASGESRTFKLATDQAADYPNTIALQSFADEVSEKTGGRLTIEIYPSAQLGDENAYLQQLHSNVYFTFRRMRTRTFR